MIKLLLLIGLGVTVSLARVVTQEITTSNVGSSSPNFQVYQSSNEMFVNGKCKYIDGVIYENGHSRPATEQDKLEIRNYQRMMIHHQMDFQKYMQSTMDDMFSNMFSAGFPFGSDEPQTPRPPRVQPIMPRMPPVPCFCSTENCSPTYHGGSSMISSSNTESTTERTP